MDGHAGADVITCGPYEALEELLVTFIPSVLSTRLLNLLCPVLLPNVHTLELAADCAARAAATPRPAGETMSPLLFASIIRRVCGMKVRPRGPTPRAPARAPSLVLTMGGSLVHLMAAIFGCGTRMDRLEVSILTALTDSDVHKFKRAVGHGIPLPRKECGVRDTADKLLPGLRVCSPRR
jgi:hypothetical protein